jgi:O-acetyl-ADP-ribose deacetylase (regulator of RNase III)
MIEWRKGDLFSSGVEVLVDPVNCVGVPGAGLALAFKRLYPKATREYIDACRRGLLRPGNVLLVASQKSPVKAVCFFPTKDDWRDPSTIEYVHSGLVALARAMITPRGDLGLPSGIQSIALPALGCGLGGLEWPAVKREIESALSKISEHRRVLCFEPPTNHKS